jgi:probable HAF family extracellular repeat protein
MSYWKSSVLTIFAAACLLGESTGFAQAQCGLIVASCATEWSGGNVINVAGLDSLAYGINDAGQVVGASGVGANKVAAEWSGGNFINLGGLPYSTISAAQSINSTGQAVGYSEFDTVIPKVVYATEWSGSSIIDLGGLPGAPRQAMLTASTTLARRWDTALLTAATHRVGGRQRHQPGRTAGGC